MRLFVVCFEPLRVELKLTPMCQEWITWVAAILCCWYFGWVQKQVINARIFGILLLNLSSHQRRALEKSKHCNFFVVFWIWFALCRHFFLLEYKLQAKLQLPFNSFYQLSSLKILIGIANIWFFALLLYYFATHVFLTKLEFVDAF